jgi:hypothetical protein
MSISTIFLNPHQRFAESLKRFDPFEGEPLLRWLDPIPKDPTLNPGSARMPVRRILVFAAVVIIPEVICSMVPSVTFGGGFWGKGGMHNGVGYFSSFLTFFGCALLLPLGRRLMGDLVNELSNSGVVTLPQNLDPKRYRPGGFLWFAEAVTRPTPARSAAWLITFFLCNTAYVYSFLTDGRQSWLTSQATPGSFFYFLHVGSEQPNFAGIFHESLLSTVYGYLVLVAARLFVVFALVCRMIANHESLRIIPTDPDRAGGLLSVGHVSLFLSLFTLLAGINNAGLTFQVILDSVNTGGSIREHGLFDALVAVWSLYITLGPVLLFLPILPLRSVMARAKREYLLRAGRFYRRVALDHSADIEHDAFRSDALEGLASFATLIETAGTMSVWPFDRNTLLRFAGVVLSPMIPLFTSQWPKIYPWLHTYLLPSA